MKIKLYFKLIGLLLLINHVQASELPTKSVVKVYSSISIANYKYPWQTSKISKFTGSGAIIKGNKILTSAHVVSDAVFIEVKKENDPKKYIAKIKFISHQADLALLEVVDKNFFDNTISLTLNDNIKHRDEVTVLGYPIGGNAISTTTGVVSRIEYSNYSWGREKLLTVQIDAAINSGNSGGPTVNKNGELIGIAMQSLTKSSNIGYIVPVVIINSFLEDIKDGIVQGFNKTQTETLKIENQNIKDYYGLKNGKGVLVTLTDKEDSVLKVNDIILAINDKEIANNGTIKSKFGRVSYHLEFHSKQIGQTIPLIVLRDKKIIDIQYKIKRTKPIIALEFDKQPRYIIFGGLTFSPLTENYLNALKLTSRRIDLLFYNKKNSKTFKEPVVMLNSIFPHSVNRGYIGTSEVLHSINNIEIRDFEHFVQLLDGIEDEYIVIDFIEKDNKVILKTKAARESFNEIKRRYYLKSDRRVK